MAKGFQTTSRINGVQYGWSSIQLAINNIPVYGITSINYKESQEADNLYGASTLPVGQGFGKITMTGSLSFYQDELEAIMAAGRAQGYTRVQDLPEFDIVVLFIAPGTIKTTTHTLKNCMIKDFGVALNEGDLANIIECELLFSELVVK